MTLDRGKLATLSRARENELVLSVYMGRESADPGQGGAWRTRLQNAIGDLRDAVQEESPEELPSFDRAAGLVSTDLESYGRVLPHEGWTAFASEGRLWHSEGLPFAPKDLVRWRQGVFVAPYLRNLKSARGVIVALADSRKARLFRYVAGELVDERELEAERSLDDLADVGMGKRSSTATAVTGVRGATRTDAARRTLDEEARRHAVRVAEAVAGLNGVGIVLGGTHRSTQALRAELESEHTRRVVEATELSFDSTRAELASAVAAAASELTLRRQADLLEECRASVDRGSVGWNQTYRALAAGAVDTMVLSRAMIEDSPDEAERLVRLALAQGAQVEELGGDLGGRLHREADGVTARLRFKPTS